MFILICIVSKQSRRRRRCGDFTSPSASCRLRRRVLAQRGMSFKGQHMLFENKYNSIMMMMIMRENDKLIGIISSFRRRRRRTA